MRKIIFIFWVGAHLPAVFAGSLPSDSLYQIPALYSRHDGQSVPLSTLQGKPLVLAMVYLNCPVVCPIALGVMKQIEATLSIAQQNEMKFVLVSFDPEKDTPLAMQTFKKDKHLGDNWAVMTGKDSDLRTLAAALDFTFKKTSKTDYSHSTGIFVVESNGVVLHKYDPPAGSAQKAVAHLIPLLGQLPRK